MCCCIMCDIYERNTNRNNSNKYIYIYYKHVIVSSNKIFIHYE